MKWTSSLVMRQIVVSMGMLLAVSTARAEPAAVPAAGFFDPARHMHVSEVKPGMTGFGLSVFKGSKIETFDIEVVSVLKNFNASNDVILIRCKGDFLEHTGSIAGMSGSPIYLKDATGKARMIGAFAYGWPLAKDPVAGVQPIEYMLKLPAGRKASVPPTRSATEPSAGARGESSGHNRAAWSLAEAGMLPLAWQNPAAVQLSAKSAGRAAVGAMLGDADAVRLQPLATPLMTGGLSPTLYDILAPRFRAAGLMPLQAGGGGSAAGAGDVQLAPGSVLAVPLMTGDLEMTAIGTTTEVLGNHIWGFGHPFNNEGPINLPMGSGVINGIIANMNTSFKLGSLTQSRGSLNMDGSVGVAGETGDVPATVPMDISVQSADGSTHTFHFNASQHAKFTPLLAGAAFLAAVTGKSELPQYNTVDYEVRLTFANGQSVDLAQRVANVASADIFGDAAIVMQAAADNPFQRVLVKSISAKVKIQPKISAAQIVDINLPKSKYRPGDKVAAFVTYQPFHGAEAVLRVELDLPKDLPAASYQLVISDATRYFADEQQAKPFRFLAQNIGDVFAVLQDVGGVRENALFVRLVRRPDGVAIGRTALQHLPPSRRDVLLAAGRSNTTAFTSSIVKIIPTEQVMVGASEFTIAVETPAKVTVGTPRGTKTEKKETLNAER